MFLVCWMIFGFAVFEDSDIAVKVPEGAACKRIVSTAPNLTEILFSLGLGEKIVAVTSDSDFPRQAAEKPKIGTFWQTSIEAIIASKPDLVVTLAFPQQRDMAERLRRMGYRTLTVNIEKVEDFFSAVKKIGEVTDAKSAAKELSDGIEAKLGRLSEQIASREKIRVLWVVQRQPLRVAGEGTFVNELIELAGGVNVIGKTAYKYPPIGSEQVIARKPDVIIEPAMSGGDITKQLEAAEAYWQGFSNVPAVVNKRIYVIDGDTVSQLGPRIYDGVETIGQCLRPEL